MSICYSKHPFIDVIEPCLYLFPFPTAMFLVVVNFDVLNGWNGFNPITVSIWCQKQPSMILRLIHFTLWCCDNAWKIWLVLPDQWCTSSGLEFERKAIFIELGVYSTSKPAINRSVCISNTLNQLLSLIIRLLFLFLSPIIVDLIYVLCINWGYCLILEKSFTFFWLSK